MWGSGTSWSRNEDAVSDLQRYGFEIKGYTGFLDLMEKSPDRLSQALVRGSRRSLGAFRRTFLEQVPVAIKGRGSSGPNQSGKRSRNIGKSFRWEVTPAKDTDATRKTHIESRIFSESLAAYGLEVGGRVTATDGQKLAIPISKSYGDNVGASGKIKPTWRYLGKVMATKARQYRFFWLPRSGGTLVMAQRRPSRNSEGKAPRSFPIFWVTTSNDMPKDQLQFYRTWETFQKEVDRRFVAEVDKELKRITQERGASRGR